MRSVEGLGSVLAGMESDRAKFDVHKDSKPPTSFHLPWDASGYVVYLPVEGSAEV